MIIVLKREEIREVDVMIGACFGASESIAEGLNLGTDSLTGLERSQIEICRLNVTLKIFKLFLEPVIIRTSTSRRSAV